MSGLARRLIKWIVRSKPVSTTSIYRIQSSYFASSSRAKRPLPQLISANAFVRIDPLGQFDTAFTPNRGALMCFVVAWHITRRTLHGS